MILLPLWLGNSGSSNLLLLHLRVRSCVVALHDVHHIRSLRIQGLELYLALTVLRVAVVIMLLSGRRNAKELFRALVPVLLRLKALAILCLIRALQLLRILGLIGFGGT